MNRLTYAALALIGAFAVVLPATTAGATPTTAGGGSLSINTGSGWTHDPSNALFDFSHVAPGWTGTATLAVRNDSNASAAIGLSATNVVEDENGCNHPESYVDTTCTGPDAGELGKEIVLTVYADANNDGTFDTTPAWTGTIESLEQRATLTQQLPAGDVSTYKIDAELPMSSGNETQTDQVTFDLDVNLDGATVAVEGTKTTRDTGGGVLRHVVDQLPLTGTPAERIAALAVALLLMGTALALAGKQRRRVELS